MFHKESIAFEGAVAIYQYKDYLILQGRDFWIRKLDGSTVVRYHNMHNVFKIKFLPQEQLLICGGTNTAYRLLSLKTGKEIWSIPTIKKSYVSGLHFAISHDGKYAYDSYNFKDEYHLVRIGLLSGDICSCKLGPGYRALRDIVCDDTCDTLYLLRTQIDNIEGHNVGFNEIQSLDFDAPRCCETICNWKSDGTQNSVAAFFLGDYKHVMSRDLSIFESRTGKVYSLVANEPNGINPGRRPIDCWFDASKQYLHLKYDNGNIIIDCKNRKMAARYAASFARGCLIDDAYWIALGDKVTKKPFPLIEDIPGCKLSTWHV